MSQLRHRCNELGAEPVLVSFATPAHTRQYIAERKLDWTVLIDERRELYHAYGMRRAPLWQVWGGPTLRAYASEIGRGQWPRRAREDVRQRGGDVLVDPDGLVRLRHVGQGPADRPSVDSIIRAGKQLA